MSQQATKSFWETIGINEFGNTDVAFRLSETLGEDLLKVANNKVMSMPFILSLTGSQRELLIETMIAGDGWIRRQHGVDGLSYCQKDKAHVDLFIALCTLAGYRTSCKLQDIVSFGKPTQIHIINLFSRDSNVSRVENIDFHGGKNNGHGDGHIGQGKVSHPNKPTIPYKGLVWCPETEYGLFMARHNGYVYLTGNSYNDEMRAQALMHLCQVGLQFDELRSDNAFAFYTQIAKHCLSGETMILTKEHGSIAIQDVSEQDVHLLDGNGDWVLCHIHDHGIQETQLTYFQGGHQKTGIWSTSNHGWISDGEVIETKDFAGKNTKIDDLRPSKVITNQENYRKGILHGLIYGDGTFQQKDAFCFRVCSHIESIIPYVSGYNSWIDKSTGYPIFYIGKAWTDLKALPGSPGDDLDYLLGFFRGWFAADGCVSKTPYSTLCGNKAEYEWVKQWGPLVGWHVNNFTKLNDVTNFGQRKKISLNFHLRTSSMDVDDFLIDQHRERWLTRPITRKGNQQGKKYDWALIEQMRQTMSWGEIANKLDTKISSIRSSYSQHRKAQRELTDFKRSWYVYGSRQKEAKRFERVYCPVVETTHSFALSCGIHSRNCFVRVINLEKRQHAIRDDMLTMAGVTPSFSRQVDNEMDQREAYETRTVTLSMSDIHVTGAGNKSDPEANLIKKEAKKRGRKPKLKTT